MTEDRDKWRKYTSMVWPTLGSRTAKRTGNGSEVGKTEAKVHERSEQWLQMEKKSWMASFDPFTVPYTRYSSYTCASIYTSLNCSELFTCNTCTLSLTDSASVTAVFIFMLVASSGKRNVTTLWRPSVRPSVCLSHRHTHRDSPGGIMRRGQRAFQPDILVNLWSSSSSSSSPRTARTITTKFFWLPQQLYARDNYIRDSPLKSL